jgi:integrase
MHRELPALGLADKPATVHDLRRTFASQMAELGFDRLTISKLLNHADPTITGAIYELSEHWEKKRVAMDAWSARLVEITSGKPMPDRIVPLREAQ